MTGGATDRNGAASATMEPGSDGDDRTDIDSDDRTDIDGDDSVGGTGSQPALAADHEPSTAGGEGDDRADSVTVTFDGETSEAEIQALAGELLYKTSPTLRPVVGLLGAVLIGGSLAVLVPLLWPTLFGDPAIAEVVLYAIAVVVVVATVRLAVRLVVLWRTQYEIREGALIRRYNLAYKRTVRKIPVSKLRGHEFTQSRYEASLGVGTIRLLTAGTNRSLGFLEFEYLSDPDTARRKVQGLFADREASSSDVR